MLHGTLPLGTDHFDEDDLRENREGRLSERQKRRVRRNGLTQTVTILAITSVGTFYFLARPFSSSAWLITIPVVVLAVLFAGICYKNAQIDVTLGRVESLWNRIELFIDTKNHYYNLRIGDHKFPVSKRLLLGLRNGEYYTAYYAPASNILLAIEPSLPTEKAKRKLTLGDDGELVPLDELADDHTDSAVQSRNG